MNEKEKAIWDESAEDPASLGRRRMKSRLRKTLMGLTGGVTVFLIGFAVAALIFSQTIPTTTAPPGMLSYCGSSSVQDAGSAVLNSTATGYAQAFDCSGGTALISVGSTVSLTVGFTLPTGAVDLYLIPHGATVPVAGCSGAGGQLLSDGSPVSIGSGSWDYCVDANASFGAFSVSWSS